MKLFVTDLDGSFLNKNHAVVPESLPLIHELEDSGCEFVVCTGRNIASIDLLFRDSDAKFVKMGLNGAIAIDVDGKLLFSKELENKDIEKMFEYSTKYNIPLSFISAHRTYSPNSDLVYKTVAQFWASSGIDVSDPRKFYEEQFELNTIVDVKDMNDLLSYGEQTLKMEFHPQNDELKNMLNEALEEISTVDVSTSGFHNIEITHIEAQKGLAVSKLCKLRGISEEDVLVVGDSFNDISMLSRFNNSYAMGQADRRIKAIANHEAKSNEEEGVLELMRKVINKEI